MNRVAIVVNGIHKSLAFEWIARHVPNHQIKLYFFLLHDRESYLEKWLMAHQLFVRRIYFAKMWHVPSSIFQLYYYLAKYKITTLHVHLLEASLVGLIAGKFAGVRRRIMTRHYALLNHRYYRRAIIFDNLCNLLATKIIAPSQVIADVLIKYERVPPDKIRIIHHGFDYTLFASKNRSLVDEMHQTYNPEKKTPVIGVVSRYTELKGVHFTIKAFAKYVQIHKNALLILANATGDYTHEIRKHLQLLPKGSYVEIPFEENIWTLYHIFDLFVHVPIEKSIEGFGQTYVEALMAGVPSVFTLAGVANEFVVHMRNAWVVPYQSSEHILEALLELTNDKSLRDTFRNQGSADVKLRFGLKQMIENLQKIYVS